MEFLQDYGLFLAKAVTVVITVALIVAIAASAGRQKKPGKGQVEVDDLNERFDAMDDRVADAVLDDASRKQRQKQRKQAEKANQKALARERKRDPEAAEQARKPRVFVLDFTGDIRAQQTDALRECISAVLGNATAKDEVVLRLESAGGLVHAYGLAASQLDRIKRAGIPLTVCVDKVAASGGYMMACVANKILAAPFAILGSIGVMAQLPNFHRLLKKNEVDIELHTAGEFKRTLTMFGENTDKAREKFKQDLDDTHDLFKDYVREHRPQLDIDTVATGEIWFGRRAVDQQLIDELMTSDDYLLQRRQDAELYQVRYEQRRNLPQKLGMAMEESADRLLGRWWGRAQDPRTEL